MSEFSAYVHPTVVHHSSTPLVGHRFKRMYEGYMVVVALCGSLFIYLQGALVLKNQSSDNISIPAMILFTLVSISWCLYGLIKKDWIISLSGVIATIGGLFATGATIAYRPNYHPGAFAWNF